MIDVLIAIAIAATCGHLGRIVDGECSRLRGLQCKPTTIEACYEHRNSSVEQCRLMLNRCIYDEQHGFVWCMRSMNE